MDENGEITAEATQALSNASAPIEAVDMNPKALSDSSYPTDGAIDMNSHQNQTSNETEAQHGTIDPFLNGQIRTLDGDIASDEFAADAINYQILLGKIDKLLEKLKLDA